MTAAGVISFAAPPRFAELPPPLPTGPDVVVDVLAAGLHPRVRSQADGSHYTSTDRFPLVPGIDGVGIDGEGQVRYFVLEDAAMGSMAEQTVADRRRSIVLPAASDPFAIAAAMNPAMSPWLALRRGPRCTLARACSSSWPRGTRVGWRSRSRGSWAPTGSSPPAATRPGSTP